MVYHPITDNLRSPVISPFWPRSASRRPESAAIRQTLRRGAACRRQSAASTSTPDAGPRPDHAPFVSTRRWTDGGRARCIWRPLRHCAEPTGGQDRSQSRNKAYCHGSGPGKPANGLRPWERIAFSKAGSGAFRPPLRAKLGFRGCRALNPDPQNECSEDRFWSARNAIVMNLHQIGTFLGAIFTRERIQTPDLKGLKRIFRIFLCKNPFLILPYSLSPFEVPVPRVQGRSIWI